MVSLEKFRLHFLSHFVLNFENPELSKICIFKEFEGRINFFWGHPVVDLHNWISPDNAQAMAPAEREPEWGEECRWMRAVSANGQNSDDCRLYWHLMKCRNKFRGKKWHFIVVRFFAAAAPQQQDWYRRQRRRAAAAARGGGSRQLMEWEVWNIL